MKRLAEYLPSLLSGREEKDAFKQELRHYSVAESHSFPPMSLRIDVWWSQASESFPILSRVASAYLTIFSGPMIESTFSEMGNILTSKRSRLAIDTYNSQHAIKQHFQGSAVEKCRREDVTASPVYMGRWLVKNMEGASALYRQNCDNPNDKLPSKRQFVSEVVDAEVKLKKKHHQPFPE